MHPSALTSCCLMHSDNMEETVCVMLSCSVAGAAAAELLQPCLSQLRHNETEVFACSLSNRLKQPNLRSPNGNCQPCPVSSTGPVCGSDGHNYASKVQWERVVELFHTGAMLFLRNLRRTLNNNGWTEFLRNKSYFWLIFWYFVDNLGLLWLLEGKLYILIPPHL